MLRRLLLENRAFAAWVIAVALLMKMLVPTGFMPVVSADGIGIIVCSGVSPPTAVMAMPGMAHDGSGMTHHRPGTTHDGTMPDHQGKGIPCAFSGLSAPSLAATDPLLLAIAIAFVVATVFRGATTERVSVPAFLRPQLRGPPA